MDSEGTDEAEAGTVGATSRGPYTGIFLLGFVLVLLKVVVTFHVQSVGTLRMDMSVAFLVALGAVLGLHGRGSRRMAVAIGSGVGAGEMVPGLLMIALRNNVYQDVTDLLSFVLLRGVLIGAIVAGVTLLAHRCSRLFRASRWAAPGRSDRIRAGGANDRSKAGSGRPAGSDGSGTDPRPAVQTAAFLVALFGTVVALNLGTTFFWTDDWYLQDQSVVVLGDYTLLLLAVLGGVVVGLADGRRSLRRDAAVGVGAAVGALLVTAVSLGIDALSAGGLLVSVTLLGGVTATAAAVWRLRKPSGQAVLGATALGCGLVAVVLLGSSPEQSAPTLVFTESGIVALAGGAAHRAVTALTSGTSVGPGATDASASPDRLAVATALLGAALPLAVLSTRVGVKGMFQTFVFPFPRLADWLLFLHVLHEHVWGYLALLVVVVGSTVGVTSDDGVRRSGAGLLLGLVVGAALPLLYSGLFLPIDRLDIVPGPGQFASQLLLVLLVHGIGGSFTVAAGRWYAR